MSKECLSKLDVKHRVRKTKLPQPITESTDTPKVPEISFTEGWFRGHGRIDASSFFEQLDDDRDPRGISRKRTEDPTMTSGSVKHSFNTQRD